jgi:hypothetical protein
MELNMAAKKKILFVMMLLLAALAILMNSALAQETLADYAKEAAESGAVAQYYTGTESEGLVTLLPELPWENPDLTDPANDAKDPYEDITSVYVDEDEKRIYFRIKLSATGDSAEPFTRYVYVLIDGKVGGKKRVAKNVYGEIPWDILIKLKNPDDLAAYTMNSLLTIEINNFSSNPQAKVMSFYIDKRFIRDVIPWEGNDDIRFQVFTQNKETDRPGDSTAVFYLNSESTKQAIPDITRMMESVTEVGDGTYSAPIGEEEAEIQNQESTSESRKTLIEKVDPKYITRQVWMVPPWLLILAGVMFSLFISILIASVIIRLKKRKAKAQKLKSEMKKEMKKEIRSKERAKAQRKSIAPQKARKSSKSAKTKHAENKKKKGRKRDR